MSGHNFSRSVTTFSGNAMTFSLDMTTLSPNLTNITCKPYNNSVMSSIQKEHVRDNSTNSTERNVFDPFNSVLYSPLLSVFDILQLLGCVLIIILIYKENRIRDIPSRFLLNMNVAEMSIGLSFLFLNISMLTTSDTSLMKKFFLAQKLIFTLMRSEAMHTLAMMLFTLHLAICSPFYYKMYCRTRYFLTFLLVSWTFNVTYSCCVFFLELRDMDDLSLVIWLYAGRFPLPATILYIIVAVILPFLAITVCFIRIRIHIKQERKACINQSLTRSNIRQAKVVYLIAFAFFLTSFTSDILGLMMLPEFKLKDKLYVAKNVFAIIAYLFVYLNVPLLLYGFKSYRRVFFSMFNCCQSRPRRSCNVTIVELGQKSISESIAGTFSENSDVCTSVT